MALENIERQMKEEAKQMNAEERDDELDQGMIKQYEAEIQDLKTQNKKQLCQMQYMI